VDGERAVVFGIPMAERVEMPSGQLLEIHARDGSGWYRVVRHVIWEPTSTGWIGYVEVLSADPAGVDPATLTPIPVGEATLVERPG